MESNLRTRRNMKELYISIINFDRKRPIAERIKQNGQHLDTPLPKST